MSTITKEQWQQIEEELKGMFCDVRFNLQGHELLVRRAQVGEGRWELVVYIDKSIKPICGMPSHEEFLPIVEQVWRKRSKARYSPKRQKEIIKIWGKRRAKKEWPDLEAKIYWYDFIFKTASSVVRQYRKIEGLELVSIGYQSETEQEQEPKSA